MTSAPFLQRQLGDYLLVAQLSEDALGTVFRALCAADERRFVRLRILRSEGLSPEAIEQLIARQSAAAIEPLVHEAIVHRPQFDIVEGIPFMTWDETYGWTLDTMLSRVRTFGIRIPAEYALLIAQRIAAALEHVHRTVQNGSPAHHGLLWPGFISISHDATIRIGGFGLAEGVLPSLSAARVSTEIAPYLAPEVRDGGTTSASADVYSLGVILAELLTGRRPTLDTPSTEMRAGDPRSDELGSFLQRCVAPVKERFASAAEAHRALQLMVTGNPFSLYTANLALFLYKLLNPESQSVVADSESTNPIVKGAQVPQSEAPLESSSTSVPLARATEIAPAEPAPVPVPAEPALAASPVEAAEIFSMPEELAVSMEEAVSMEVMEEIVEIEEFVEIAPEALLPIPETQVVAAEALWLERQEAAAAPELFPAVAPADPTAVPALARQHALELLEQTVSRPMRALATAWSRPAAALAAAAGLSVGAFVLASQFHAPGLHAAIRTPATASSAVLSPVAATDASLRPASAPEPAAPAAAPINLALSGSTGSFQHAVAKPAASTRPSKPVKTESRQPAEDLRLRAALARIDADRLNAKEAAGDLFGEGRHSEEEGERLLRQRDYDAAQLAFSRAARLFQKAGEISWEERVRQANPGAAQ